MTSSTGRPISDSPAKPVPVWSLPKRSQAKRIGGGVQGDIFDLAGQRLGVLEIEFHEGLYLGAIGRLAIHVDEQRPRQRVGCILDGLHARQNGPVVSLLRVDRQGLEFALVGDIVGEGEISQRVLVTGDSLDDDVVVFVGTVVAAARLGLSDDRFREVIESSRIGAGPVKRQFSVGPVGIHLVPAETFPFASGSHMVFNWPTVIESSGLSVFTATVRASNETGNSMYSMWLSRAACISS